MERPPSPHPDDTATRRSAAAASRAARALDWAAWVLPACLAAAIACGFWGFSYDDNFITYRYARNVAEHGELAYNLGQRVLGTSAPGYALLLGGLTRLSGDQAWAGPPAWGTLGAVAALCIATLVLWQLLRAAPRGQRCGATLLFALFAGTLQWNVEMLGGEALPVLALVMAGAYLALHDRPALGGVLLSLAAILRLDAALAACCVGAVLLGRDRRLPVKFAAAAMVPAAGFLAWLFAAFGTVIPHTMAVKRSELLAGARYTLGEWQWLRRCLPDGGAAWLLLLALAALAVVLAGAWAGGAGAAKAGGWTPVAASDRLTAQVLGVWVALHEVAYHLLGVPFAPWYQVYLVNALLALAAVGIARVAARIGAVLPLPAPARIAVAVAAALLIAAPLAPGRYVAAHCGTPPDPRYAGYTAAGDYLRTHAAGTPSAAAVEIGFFGYASRARILDLVGLVSPQSLAARAAGRLPRLVEQERPDYLLDATLFHQQYLDPGADPVLAAEYGEVARFPDGRGAGLAIRLLRLRPDRGP